VDHPNTRMRGIGTVRDAAARDLKFQALADDLRRGILAGDWSSGAKLPTESQLAQDTGLSLTTVRRAFDELVEQGLVVRRQGAGSFVASPPAAQPVRTRRVGVLIPDAQQYYPVYCKGSRMPCRWPAPDWNCRPITTIRMRRSEIWRSF
jgi:GntR family transcriptional regulator of arabinose operon